MPKESTIHWRRAELIQEVKFDHEKIVVTGHYPEEISFGFVTFDLRKVGEIICQDFREELRTVQQTLMCYPNTAFYEIEHFAPHMPALDPKKQCYALWPYLLNRPFSATEAATALAAIILVATELGLETEKFASKYYASKFNEYMVDIMDKAIKWRPADFMLRNLKKKVEAILNSRPKEARPEKLVNYLKKFIATLKDNCEEMAVQASEKIKRGDALIIYGYSTNVERLLKKIDPGHPLYIVECNNVDGDCLKSDENELIIRVAKKYDFSEINFLQLGSLAQTLGKITDKDKLNCKLILGTHGVLENGDLLCKVGSHTLVRTVVEFEVEVLAFAEKMKFLKNGMSDDKIAGRGRFFSSKTWENFAGIDGITYITPIMDCIPKLLVNIMVDEEIAVPT